MLPCYHVSVLKQPEEWAHVYLTANQYNHRNSHCRSFLCIVQQIRYAHGIYRVMSMHAVLWASRDYIMTYAELIHTQIAALWRKFNMSHLCSRWQSLRPPYSVHRGMKTPWAHLKHCVTLSEEVWFQMHEHNAGVCAFKQLKWSCAALLWLYCNMLIVFLMIVLVFYFKAVHSLDTNWFWNSLHFE